MSRSITREDGMRVASPGSPYAGMRIISERVVEKEVRVPRVIRTEEVVERLATTSEVVRREEIVEETHKVREKVTEIERPVIQETIVEVDQSDAIDEAAAEASASAAAETGREEGHWEEVEEKGAETIIQQERIIEEVEIEYKDVPVEKIVEVPEIYEEVVVVEKKVPQLVEREEIEYRDIPVDRKVERAIPVPLEAVVETQFEIPAIEQVYTQVDMPIYVPRFIEIACPVEFGDEESLTKMRRYHEKLTALMTQSVVSWMEVESLASDIKNLNIQHEQSGALGRCRMTETLMKYWQAGELPQYGSHRITYPQRSPLDPLFTKQYSRSGDAPLVQEVGAKW